MSPYVRYTLMRISLFLLTALVLYAATFRGLLLVALALVISALLSYLLLGGPRQLVVQRIEQRLAARRERVAARTSRADADNAAEDAEDDSRRG